MYATATELATFLKQDVDTSTAELAIQLASQMFSTRANTMFADTLTTYQTQGGPYRELYLPFAPVSAVSEVRIINSSSGTTVVTDYTRIKSVLYRLVGFGLCVFPPDLVEVDLTYGYTVCPDDVKGAVLESAGGAYMSPDVTTKSESLDDYSVSYAQNLGGVSLTPSAQALADLYRGSIIL
jgi:hypothetical protein